MEQINAAENWRAHTGPLGLAYVLRCHNANKLDAKPRLELGSPRLEETEYSNPKRICKCAMECMRREYLQYVDGSDCSGA